MTGRRRWSRTPDNAQEDVSIPANRHVTAQSVPRSASCPNGIPIAAIQRVKP
jgi:hypothetical protein